MGGKELQEELGCAGHFIGAQDCTWRRHTQIPGYRISSVGNYYPRGLKGRREIGAGPDAYFETYVFKLTDTPLEGSEGCGCRIVADWCEIEGRRYATAGEAQRGHEEMVEKYLAAKAPQEKEDGPQ